MCCLYIFFHKVALQIFNILKINWVGFFKFTELRFLYSGNKLFIIYMICSLSLHVLNCVFWRADDLILIESNLLIFSPFGLCFLVLRNIYVIQGHKDALLSFRKVLHLDLWSNLGFFNYNMSKGWKFFFFHMPWMASCLSAVSLNCLSSFLSICSGRRCTAGYFYFCNCSWNQTVFVLDFLLFKVVLAILNPLYFYINFSVSLSVPIK